MHSRLQMTSLLQLLPPMKMQLRVDQLLRWNINGRLLMFCPKRVLMREQRLIRKLMMHLRHLLKLLRHMKHPNYILFSSPKFLLLFKVILKFFKKNVNCTFSRKNQQNNLMEASLDAAGTMNYKRELTVSQRSLSTEILTKEMVLSLHTHI